MCSLLFQSAQKWFRMFNPVLIRFMLRSAVVVLTILLGLQLMGLPTQVEASQPRTGESVTQLPVGKTLNVATRVIPPFVIQQGTELSGFSIDLWRSLAAEMGVQSNFQIYPNVSKLLEAVAAKKVDLGIAAISISAERERKFDFSQPIFSGGLQIMVRDPRSGGTAVNPLKNIFTSTLPQLVGLALLMVAIVAHVVWLVERHHAEAMISKRYFPGIFDAAWWAAATLAAQSDQMPKGLVTRVLALLWMFTSVLFIAYFTAAFTTTLTVQQLQGDIQAVSDLASRTVATTTGSTAADYLRQRRIKVLEAPSIDGVYDALLNRQADAVVFDSGVLSYYATHDGQHKVQVVGDIFEPESYGIVMPSGSPLRKEINIALLELKENGTYQMLYDRFFSANNAANN
jgi:polar amino acid transport system substrate-binding protein